MEGLLRILKELHPEIDFEKETHLMDDMILNSFDIISIVADVKIEYNVIVPAECIISDNFNSASALYSLIQRLSGLQ